MLTHSDKGDKGYDGDKRLLVNYITFITSITLIYLGSINISFFESGTCFPSNPIEVDEGFIIQSDMPLAIFLIPESTEETPLLELK